MRALENVFVCERGRKGASKQLMDWCSLFFFFLDRDTFKYVLANERVVMLPIFIAG